MPARAAGGYYSSPVMPCQALFFTIVHTFVEPAKVAQVIVKNLASVTGKLGNREPHVGKDLHVALKALAGFVVHGVIISQISGQGQLLRNLFLRCLRNGKGNLQPPHLHEPNPANLFHVHGDILSLLTVDCNTMCNGL